RHITDAGSAYRTLGANIVVEGGLQRRNQKLILTLNLVDAKNLRQIGSEEIEGQNEDFAALEDEAISRLARLLKAKVPEASVAQTKTYDHSSYEAYVKALGYLQRYDKPGNLDKAISTLESATRKDPQFALGFATLGEAFRLKFQAENHLPYLTDAADNAKKAIELNDH